jgi:hypothetical protein
LIPHERAYRHQLSESSATRRSSPRSGLPVTWELNGSLLPPWLARNIIDCLRSSCEQCLVDGQPGRFQAMMQVQLVNEGPVTISLDSRKAL